MSSCLPSKPRRAPAKIASGVLVFSILSSCSPPAPATPVGEDLSEITRLARQEGKVHLIAYPKDWANYGESFAKFKEKYGVGVEVSSPDISSGEELSAVKNLKGQPTQPDVLDIGYSFTQPAIEQGLLDKYTPSSIADVPKALQDPEGHWVGAYYGVLSIGVDANKVAVPTSFADLLDPQYKGKIMIGDPREGASVLAAVSAAALANGGSLDDIKPGVDFFAKLAEQGYLAHASSNAAALETGEAAVTFDWNYNYSGVKDSLAAAGVDLRTVVPNDGVFGNYYAQPVTASSPHPNAGRLWIEWLLSDEGAICYAKSGAVPARYAAMVKAGSMPAEARKALPPPEVLDKITFPTLAQGQAANQVVMDAWGRRVANAGGR